MTFSTQAIIDAYTIHRHLGRLDNLHVVFGYDSLQSRSIHSLTRLLAQYPGNRFTFIGPEALFPAPAMLEELTQMGVQCEARDIAAVTEDVDIIYLNRLQEERFADPALFEANRKKYRLTTADLTDSDALILDPESRSDTYPYIEIAEQDVSIGHEASVSRIGEEQLFYLMSRGLSEAEASTMIVNGFIEPLIKELPMEYAVEMNRLIQLQMEGSVG